MNELDTRAERFLESIRAEGEAAAPLSTRRPSGKFPASWTLPAKPKTPVWSAPCTLRLSVPAPALTAI